MKVLKQGSLLQAVPEYQYSDYSDIWGDYPEEESFWEEYPDEEESLPSSFNNIQRINFAKYGRQNRSSDTKDEVTSSLPDNIYCDLVTTLSDKCIQVCTNSS